MGKIMGKFFSKEDMMDIEMILMVYRYSSLAFLGILYIIGFSGQSTSLKLAILLALFLQATLFMVLYKKHRNDLMEMRIIIVVELILLSLVLYFTGGKDSPFLGYSVIPILLSTTLSATYFPWLLLSFFLVVNMFFSLEGNTPLFQLEFEGFYFAIVIILITLGAQFYHDIITKLSEQKNTMKNYISLTNSLYESLDAFSKYNSPQEIINLFTSYTKEITKSPKVITYITIDEKDNQKPFYCVRGSQMEFKEEIWLKYIQQFYNSTVKKNVEMIPLDQPVNGYYLIMKIQTDTNFYGALTAFYYKDTELSENVKAMEFLAKLCGEVLDKHELETAALNFELSREKDRIANEIHDNVTQNLFGLIYGLDNLKIDANLNERELNNVKIMQNTAQNSIKELRKAIYQISSMKKNTDAFLEEIREYFWDLKALHNIEIDFICNVVHTNLSGVQQNAIYRILRESTGNALHHGGAKKIIIRIFEDANCFDITIEDNGKGFRPELLNKQKKNGLGLINMKEISRNLGGTLHIESEVNKGTIIRCKIGLQSEKTIV